VTLLAIDTATRSCSVGLLSRDRVLAEAHRADGQTHSRHLMAMIDDVLAQCRSAICDLSAVAVTIGPGSFTGLRIGLATAKGLAVAADVPMVGVVTLEALARQAAEPDAEMVCPLIDARKGEVYGGFFDPGTDGVPRMRGRLFVCPPERALAKIERACLFIGDGALLYRERIRRGIGPLARFAPEKDHVIRAATVGRMARQTLEAGGGCDPGRLAPLYVRKSDAELRLGAPVAGFR
jgi:tRNA threonylcarbamoyladenosine biosynthesis protein TsaB